MMSLPSPAWDLAGSKSSSPSNANRFLRPWVQDYCGLGVREGCKKMGVSSVNPTPSSKTILKGSHPKQVLKISTQEVPQSAPNRKRVIQLYKATVCNQAASLNSLGSFLVL